MSAHNFYLKPMPSSNLLEAFIRAVTEGCAPLLVENFYVRSNLGPFSAPNGWNGHNLGVLSTDQGLKDFIELLRARPFSELETISFRARNNALAVEFKTAKDSPPYIQVSWNEEASVLEVFRRCLDALHKHFNLIRHFEALEAGLSEKQKAMVRFNEQVIGDFASHVAKLGNTISDQYAQFLEETRKKNDALDHDFQKKREELEAKHAARLKEQEEREKQFRERVAQFDSRDSKEVRRNLLERISGKIEEQKKMELSSTTIEKRAIIHKICIATIGFSALIAVVFLYKVFTDGSKWEYLVPVSTGMLLFVSTTVFYIRWNDQWFKEHAHAEFSNRKFAADILRASWVAELFFEWEKRKESQFPPEFMQSLTKGLFEEGQWANKPQHPFDQLHGLMNDVSKLKVSKTGIELSKEKSGEDKAGRPT